MLSKAFERINEAHAEVLSSIHARGGSHKVLDQVERLLSRCRVECARVMLEERQGK
jgi:hypothetical protein